MWTQLERLLAVTPSGLPFYMTLDGQQSRRNVIIWLLECAENQILHALTGAGFSWALTYLHSVTARVFIDLQEQDWWEEWQEDNQESWTDEIAKAQSFSRQLALSWLAHVHEHKKAEAVYNKRWFGHEPTLHKKWLKSKPRRTGIESWEEWPMIMPPLMVKNIKTSRDGYFAETHYHVQIRSEP